MREARAGAARRLLVAGLSLVATGCGGASAITPPSVASRADVLLRASAAMLEKQRSFHATGMLTAGYGVDLEISRGVGASGTVLYRGLRWEVTVVGTDVYFRGAALWRATQAPEITATFGEQWVMMRGAVGYYGFLELLPRVATDIPRQIFAQHHAVDHIMGGWFAGRRTLHLTGPGDTYDVSDDGATRLPLRWTDLREPPADGQLCGLTLDRFNATPVITAPAALPYTGARQVVGTTPPAIG